MYEVILPKKLGYFGKVQEVLEDLFDEQAIRAVPFIQKFIRDRRRQAGDFDEDSWIKTLCQASRGYSIYEMDGRYLSPQGPVDERVLVIRFIFHNPSEPADVRNRFPGGVARGGELPGCAPAGRRAGGRRGDLVPGVSSAPARDLAQGRLRERCRRGICRELSHISH